MSLTNLPPELLLAIAFYLPEESDLLSLLLLNHRTHSLLHSTLYTYNIRHNGSSALLWAARIISSRRRCIYSTTARMGMLGPDCGDKNIDGDGGEYGTS
ncbi:hypothetical protein EMCG_07742 [[Emmonsia] crescens]|uniref:F-box domain-containing protein n=1 Tax=[Emmonsia] crescens TaxID=73230 RepID=A0A0G2I7Q1_9EURO|nr:hypothetical protein EMCG_07742 [Emmonsia crescens UAMH 3008]